MFLKKIKLSSPLTIITLTTIVIATLFVVQNLKDPLYLFTKAVVGNAVVELRPASSTLPPAKMYELWITTTQKVGFVRTVVNFDQTKLKVTNEPVIVLPGFTKISQTSMLDANNSGVLIFVAGLDPAQIANAPTGAFLFTNINFDAKTPISNITTSLNINIVDSQIVNIDTTLMALTAQNSTVTVSVASTPTPTNQPTETSTPITYPNWDIDQNGIINIIDIGLVIDQYNKTNFTNPRVDVDRNGIINIVDIGIIIDHYQ